MPVLPSEWNEQTPETSNEAGTTAGNWPPKDGDLRGDCEGEYRQEGDDTQVPGEPDSHRGA